MTESKNVRGVYTAGPAHWVGDGFHVRNLFPSRELDSSATDPFLLLDYAGPTRVEPSETPRGVGEHPHRGFETVTLVYQGMLCHRDSGGHGGTIGPGDVQWMTAAAGVVHEEKYDAEFARQGGTMEMVQLWINLPQEQKMAQPRYQLLMKEQIPVSTLGPAGYMRVIAGCMSGIEGPAQTYSPVGVVDLYLNGGHDTELCLCAGQTAAIVLLKGSIRINDTTDVNGQAMMALLDSEHSMVTIAARENSTMLVLTGAPLGEPVVSQGPFVMNTREEIHQAIEDYRAGRMGRL